MDWEEFVQRGYERRERSIARQDLRAKRTAWGIMIVSIILAWYVIIVMTWGVMT